MYSTVLDSPVFCSAHSTVYGTVQCSTWYSCFHANTAYRYFEMYHTKSRISTVKIHKVYDSSIIGLWQVKNDEDLMSFCVWGLG
jgi:hypothetical protein